MHISVREWQIIDLISDGFTDTQIANKLKIAKGTVRTHLERIYLKTNADGRIAMLKAVGYINAPRKFKYKREVIND